MVLFSSVLVLEHLYIHLNSILGQVRFQGQHLARVHVGVVSVLERLLQLLQLVRGEDCPGLIN